MVYNLEMNRKHIGTRIKECRIKADISMSALARALSITPPAVQKWEDGKASPRNSKLAAIALALGVSVRELILGTNLDGISGDEPKGTTDLKNEKYLPNRTADERSGLVPLIPWEQVAAWGKQLNTATAIAEEWLKCPFKHGENAFVVEVTGESNFDPGGAKSYAPGDFVYVDPDREIKNRSMVVVCMAEGERASLKQVLLDDDGTRLLRNLNPDWPKHQAERMPHDATIIGVVIGKLVPE